MKRVKKVEIGKVVQVPVYEFAPFRRGWNGWLFQVGIIKKLGKTKSGNICVLVEYPARDYKQKRYHLNGTEAETTANILAKWFNIEAVFEFDFWGCNRDLEHPREYWCSKTYSVDTEFLIDKEILKEHIFNN